MASETYRILVLAGPHGERVAWPTAILSWAGHRVERATTPADAVRMIRSARYDLLMLAYGSDPDDVQRATDVLEDPEARLPTLVLLTTAEEFVTPPQTHFVPTAFLEPGFTSDELLRYVEQLSQLRA